MEEWRKDYNEVCANSAIGKKPPYSSQTAQEHTATPERKPRKIPSRAVKDREEAHQPLEDTSHTIEVGRSVTGSGGCMKRFQLGLVQPERIPLHRRVP